MHSHDGAASPRTTARTVALAAAVLALALTAEAFGSSAASAQTTRAPDAEATFADWTTVDTGGAATCAIRAPGQLYCWGDDSYGQIGNGPAAGDRRTPTRVGTASDWTSVSVGESSACGRRRSGRLYCWGADGAGQLGNDQARAGRTVPTEVAGHLTTWTSVSVGTTHACAVRTNGRLFCWGADGHQQLGNGAASGDRPVPVPVAGGARDWASVTAGMFHTCARSTGARLACWGRNLEGQIGDSSLGPDRVAPVAVPGFEWTGQASVGAAFTCARRPDGAISCWGTDAYGQLGNGPNGSTATPQIPVGLTSSTTAVAAGELHACAIAFGGVMACWGSNASGQLGSDHFGGPGSIPTQVEGSQVWRQVSAGRQHTCGLTTGRRLFCWGGNGDGQLGIGSTVPRNRPTEVGTTVAPV